MQEPSHNRSEGQIDHFAIAWESIITFAGLTLWKERNISSWPVCSHPVLIPSLCLEAQVVWLCEPSGLIACVHHMPPVLCHLWHCILRSSMRRLNMMCHQAGRWHLHKKQLLKPTAARMPRPQVQEHVSFCKR